MQKHPQSGTIYTIICGAEKGKQGRIYASYGRSPCAASGIVELSITDGAGQPTGEYSALTPARWLSPTDYL